MRNKKLQGQVTAGRWTLPIVVFICTLCWVLTSFLLPDLTASTVEDSTLSLWQSARDLLLPAWAERLVSYLIYAVIGYSLIELNNRFGIIRMRASMQTAIYFLLVTICPEMHLLYAGDIAALAFLFSIYFLFKSYQQPQAAGYLFYSFLFIGAGSLLFPQLTFLSVLWIFEAHRFQALKPRSFCGALLGWVLPYWFLFGHAFFYNQMELFYRPFTELVTFGKPFDLQILQPWELAVLGYLLVLFIVSAAHCIIAGFEDKIRTRAYLQFLIDLNIFLFLLIALQPTYCANLLPLLMISSSILTGYSPERFFNLCGNADIVLWKIEPAEDGYTFFVSLPAFRKLKPMLRKSGTRVTILKRVGVPFLLYRYHAHLLSYLIKFFFR